MADIVGLVASILQLVDTVAKTRDHLQDFRNAPQDQQQLLREIESLGPLIQELKDRLEGRRAARLTQNLEKPLQEVGEVLERLTKKLDLQGIKKFSGRLTWSLWEKDDIHDGLGTIERFKSLLNAWLGVDISSSNPTDVSSSVQLWSICRSCAGAETEDETSVRFYASNMMGSLASSSKARKGYHEHTVSLLAHASEEQQINHHYLSTTVRNVGKQQEQFHTRTVSLLESAAEEQQINHHYLSTTVRNAGKQQEHFHTRTISRLENVVKEQGRHYKSLSTSVRDVGNSQEEYYSAAERDKIIEWFSPLNMFLRQADIFSSWEPGTGMWLLDHRLFREWKSGRGKTLWCQGMPGAGKTVLASLIANTLHLEAEDLITKHRQKKQIEMESQNIGVAIIYLEHRETDVPSPSRLLAALWRQLVVGKLLSQFIIQLYRKHREQGTQPTIGEDDAVLRSIISEYSKVYILADGLDEYPQEPRDILLGYLGALGSSVNLLLTSRPHITVDHVIPSYETLDIRATEDDIRTFLGSRISKSFRLTKHLSKSPNLHQELEATIVERSDGMFLLAKLHFDSLTKTCTVKDVRDTLKNMADNLDMAYDAVMDRINQQDPKDTKLACRTLSWVTHAKRPLRCSELRGALAVEPGTTDLNRENLPDIDVVLSVCAGLVVINENDDQIRLIHYTTELYLQSARVCASAFPRAQSDITTTCITYLSFGFEAISPALRQPMFLFTYNPFLHYAVEYCLSHAKGPPESEIKPSLMLFLSNCSLWRTLWTWKYGGVPLPSDRLSLAATFNLEETLGYIIREDGFNFSALLHEAASCGATGVVRILLKSGVNVRAHGLQCHYSISNAPAILSLLINDNFRAKQDPQEGTLITKQGENILKLLIESGVSMEADGGQALKAASDNGHMAIVKLLVEGGADVNANNGEALSDASERGNAEIVELLIKGGADVNANRAYAMRAASRNGSTDIVKLLVEAGAYVDLNGGEALSAASERGNKELVKLLIAAGADVHANGGRALWAASKNGNADVVKLLLDAGADADAGQALEAASNNGAMKIVKLLIDSGANVNAKGGRALWTASKNGDAQLIKLLIESGADVDTNGGQALCSALDNGRNAEVIKLLIEAGADVDASDGYALWSASHDFKGGAAVVKLLIEAGADVNAKNGRALRAAAEHGDTETVKLLMEAGISIENIGPALGAALKSYDKNAAVIKLLIEGRADVDASETGNARIVQRLIDGDMDANGGLCAASRNGSTALIKLLLEAGADVDADSGRALRAAPQWGNSEIVNEAGADVDANTGEALSAASERGRTDVVKLLIEAGADVNANNGEALRAASGNGHADVVKLLIEGGADVNADNGEALRIAKSRVPGLFPALYKTRWTEVQYQPDRNNSLLNPSVRL
ncbi:ankyrin repeat-containing domain protein [Mycena polygramma]|nr:ankyrin repeat-containing domain protein [Mycena polygramma]